MTVTLDWYGCMTYRLDIDGLVVFLDTFMDRLSSAPPTGMTAARMDRADYALIGHSHMDHLAGADVIAKNTGASVIGSYETARVLRDAGVPRTQLLPTQGGDRFRLSDDVTVAVYPSLHSCIWSTARLPGVETTGDLGLTYHERRALAASRPPPPALPSGLEREQAELNAGNIGSPDDGGALDYLVETPDGTVFFQNSMGYWTGILATIRADAVIMGCAGRGNIDGEPIPGTVEDFVAGVVTAVRPKRLVLGHHDNWPGALDAPDIVDISPVRARLSKVAPDVELLEPGYGDGTRLL